MEGEVINRKHFPFWSLKMKTFSVPSQGSALGIKYNNKHTPCKGKSFKILSDNKAFALTGRLADCYYTQGAALGGH